MGRFTRLVSENNTTTVANTDIFADITLQETGLLRIALDTTSAGDVRITLDGTNYVTIADTAADILTVFEIPVTAGDVFNMQTVAIETIKVLRVVLDSG